MKESSREEVQYRVLYHDKTNNIDWYRGSENGIYTYKDALYCKDQLMNDRNIDDIRIEKITKIHEIIYRV